ncbi:MAG: carboxypeptidase regulatory-like domain-containing protein [Stappiaceae bacterium]
MNRSHHKTLVLALAVCSMWAGETVAEEAITGIDTRAVVEKAIKDGDAKLQEEIDRVPGLTYEDISEVSKQIPGRVQIPDPLSSDHTSRAVSVPGGLVSAQCRHFARGFLAKRVMAANPELSAEAALNQITGHLEGHRKQYEKIAGTSGLKRSDVAIHEADCPVCGPINAAEIACHKEAVKNSPVRELVMFDYASHALRSQFDPVLSQVQSTLADDPALQVALIGRASLPGGPVPNFKLSAERISSVWYGLTKAGVAADRIVAIPIGEDEPHIDLQLALDYGLSDAFQSFGQKPLNQSVYLVVFRPDENTVPRYFDVADGEEENGPAYSIIVTDEDATLVLTDVTITASNGKADEKSSFVTDHDGIASLYGLAPGKWRLTFDRRGYDGHTQDIEIIPGKAESQTVALKATIVAFEGEQPDGESNESKRKVLNEFLAGESAGETSVTASGTPAGNTAQDKSDPLNAVINAAVADSEDQPATRVDAQSGAAVTLAAGGNVGQETADQTSPDIQLQVGKAEPSAPVDKEKIITSAEKSAADDNSEVITGAVDEANPETTGSVKDVVVVKEDSQSIEDRQAKLKLFMSGKIGLYELKNE